SIAHADGADVKIGEVLGTIEEGSTGSIGSTGSAGAATPAAATPKTNGKPAAATPSARKLAREQDVSLADVKAGGPRVTKADVEKPPSTRPPEGGLAQGQAQGPRPKEEPQAPSPRLRAEGAPAGPAGG